MNSDEKLAKKASKVDEKEVVKRSVDFWEGILRYLALRTDNSTKIVSNITRELFNYIGFTRDGQFNFF